MIEAVIFDWAGTTVDYGCFAPVKAFMEAFAHHGVPVTMEETRKPMGMLKRESTMQAAIIRAMNTRRRRSFSSPAALRQ